MPECDYLLNMADNHNLSGKFMGLKDLHVRLKVQARPPFPISHFHFHFHTYFLPSHFSFWKICIFLGLFDSYWMIRDFYFLGFLGSD